MGIECQRFGGIYGNFRRRVLVWNEYDPRAIFVLEARIPSQQPSANFPVSLLLLPISFTSKPTSDDRESEEECAKQSSCFGCCLELLPDQIGVLLEYLR